MVKELLKSFKKNWISLLYTILGIELILYSIYGELTIINAAFIAILIYIFFYIYDIVDKESRRGPIIYIITLLIVVVSSYIVINIFKGENEVEFFVWLLGAGDKVSSSKGYVLGSTIVISFIFSSMYYYFSVKINRMSVLLLLSFVSIILYIKGPYYMGNIFVYLYIGAFFLNYIYSTKVLSGDKNNSIKNKDLAISGFFIIAIMFLCTIFIPNNMFPKIKILENAKAYFREYAVDSTLKGFNVEDRSTRKINESTEDNSDIVMYSYKGELVPYLIGTSYDYYDLDIQTWKKKDKDSYYGSNVAKKDKLIIVEETKNIIDKVNNNISAEIINKNSSHNSKKTISINSKYKDDNMIVSPSNVYSVNKFDGEANIYLNEFNELFQNDDVFYKDEDYCMFYYNEIPEESSKDEYIMKNFNDEIYSELYNESKESSEIELKVKAELQYTEYENIKNIYTELNKNTSSRLIDLSNNLTVNCNSCYEKTKVIEDYFRNGEYIYNLNLPKYEGDDFIDYFIFEGKEGYCVQYATAMTLMCRASGIPARYVEGYLVTENDLDKDSGIYNVNAKGAHAFVQVFIPGYGWKIFDPTPSSEDSEIINYYVENNKEFNLTLPIIIFIIIVGGISTYFLLTRKKRKLRMIMKLPYEEALEELIKLTIKELNKIDLNLRKEETLICFAKRVDKEININYTELIERYYICKYGQESFEKQDVIDAVKLYEEVKIVNSEELRVKR